MTTPPPKGLNQDTTRGHYDAQQSRDHFEKHRQPVHSLIQFTQGQGWVGDLVLWGEGSSFHKFTIFYHFIHKIVQTYVMTTSPQDQIRIFKANGQAACNHATIQNVQLV